MTSHYADLLAARLSEADRPLVYAPVCLSRAAAQALRDAAIAHAQAELDARNGRANKAAVDKAKKAMTAAEADVRAAMVHLALQPMTSAEYRAFAAKHTGNTLERDRAMVIAEYQHAITPDGERVDAITADVLPDLLDSLSEGEVTQVTSAAQVATWGAVDFPTSCAVSEKTRR